MSEETGKIITSFLVAIAAIFIVLFVIASTLTARWMIKRNSVKVELEQMEATNDVVGEISEEEIVVTRTDDAERTLRSIYMTATT